MVDTIGGGGGWPLNGLPVGLGMALAAHQSALDNYSKLTEAEKEKIIAESHNVKSREEMDTIINSLV